MLQFIYLQKRTATLKHKLANIFIEELGSKLLSIRWPKDLLRRKVRKRPENKICKNAFIIKIHVSYWDLNLLT